MPAMTTPVSLATVQVADADFLQSTENKDFHENRVTVNYQLALELKSKLTQVMSSHKEISIAFSLRLRSSYKPSTQMHLFGSDLI